MHNPLGVLISNLKYSSTYTRYNSDKEFWSIRVWSRIGHAHRKRFVMF